MHLSDTLATGLLATRLRARTLRPAPAPAAAPTDDTLAHIRARCERAMQLCEAESAGVSVFDTGAADALVWIATTGAMRVHEGQRFVMHDSMCGICFSYRDSQLFIQPQRYFDWMEAAGLVVEEALVVPLFGPYGSLYGTLWVMTHGPGGTAFDAEDARILHDLGKGMYARIWAHDAARRLAAESPAGN